MEAVLLWLLAGALILLGVAGTILPALPGVPLVFAGLVVAAWIDNFTRVGMWTLVAIGVLAALAMLVDFAAAALGAKRVGASPLALAGATLGAIVGIFFGIPGIFFGPFFGAFGGELIAQGRIGNASKVGFATWIGLIFGALAKIAIVFVMLAIFVAGSLLNAKA